MQTKSSDRLALEAQLHAKLKEAHERYKVAGRIIGAFWISNNTGPFHPRTAHWRSSGTRRGIRRSQQLQAHFAGIHRLRVAGKGSFIGMVTIPPLVSER
jgi:hypothetical protein